jgi:histidinol dehydrogenase
MSNLNKRLRGRNVMIPITVASKWKPRRLAQTQSSKILAIVKNIITQVRTAGDQALYALTKEIDGVQLDTLLVTAEEKEQAFSQVDPAFVDALNMSKDRIQKFHERERRASWWEPEPDGTILGQLIRQLERVGVYVPGGRAAYPSSVLMNVIPAVVAGVEEIVMVTPPTENGQIPAITLVAAQIAGIETIYKVGGAQAIAALAYGTDSIAAVDKIVGPGNQYVALAKQLVYGQVDIDSIAGPSEIVIVADGTANPAYVAADLLAQAEHDPESAAILITSSVTLADSVTKELEEQCAKLSRAEIAATSLHKHGAIVLTKDVDEALKVANEIAPEHLELMIEEPWAYLGKVRHAGAVFLGSMSPETIGDYIAGPSHVLPTSGTARFFSPLGVDTFLKKTSLISYSEQAFLRDAKQVITLAEQEGLGAHAASIRIRMEEEKK